MGNSEVLEGDDPYKETLDLLCKSRQKECLDKQIHFSQKNKKKQTKKKKNKKNHTNKTKTKNTQTKQKQTKKQQQNKTTTIHFLGTQ